MINKLYIFYVILWLISFRLYLAMFVFIIAKTYLSAGYLCKQFGPWSVWTHHRFWSGYSGCFATLNSANKVGRQVIELFIEQNMNAYRNHSHCCNFMRFHIYQNIFKYINFIQSGIDRNLHICISARIWKLYWLTVHKVVTTCTENEVNI